ncbi:Transposase and inactivated derivatives [Mannheimia haemolytica]|uniref:Transposase and inactivated derivatives n=1 Tax=Mannheimia haemolytica TaxID=75985 RepID=A0A378MUK5_MANHA|nr:Transposase and inactivated derivatives [Mannheimia haemolytica]
MSRKYKFHEKSGAYFVSFATVYWVGVFVREIYFQVIVDALDYCRKHKGMILYAYCIMPTHIHLLFQAENQNPSDLIRDFKTFTAKILIQRIKDNLQENRREWLLWMFSRAAERRCNVKQYQFWQHHNQPIEIYSQKFFDEKLNYIHQNPVVSGFVSEPWNGNIIEINCLYFCDLCRKIVNFYLSVGEFCVNSAYYVLVKGIL